MKKPVRISLGKANEALTVSAASELASFLVGGSSGSGKSVLLHQIIRQVTERYSSDEAKLLLLDPKWVEFAEYGGNPYLLQPVLTGKTEAVEALENLEKKGSEIPVFILIDEYADWSYDDRFCEAVKEIARHGKQQKLYLFVATQCVTRAVITKELHDAFDHVAALRTLDEDASRLLIGESGAEELPPFGEMLFLKK